MCTAGAASSGCGCSGDGPSTCFTGGLSPPKVVSQLLSPGPPAAAVAALTELPTEAVLPPRLSRDSRRRGTGSGAISTWGTAQGAAAATVVPVEDADVITAGAGRGAGVAKVLPRPKKAPVDRPTAAVG